MRVGSGARSNGPYLYCLPCLADMRWWWGTKGARRHWRCHVRGRLWATGGSTLLFSPGLAAADSLLSPCPPRPQRLAVHCSHAQPISNVRAPVSPTRRPQFPARCLFAFIRASSWRYSRSQMPALDRRVIACSQLGPCLNICTLNSGHAQHHPCPPGSKVC